VRAFVAVFPPLPVRRALAGAARELQMAGEVRWVRPENLHLTLKFLGEISDDDLSLVSGALEPLGPRYAPFEAGLSGFGAFPSPKRARIVWAGIGEGSEPLRSLATDVEASLEPLGFVREGREYTPHLTLGRARGRPVRLGAVESPSALPGFTVTGVELVESTLGAAGATYSTLATYPLSENGDQGPD